MEKRLDEYIRTLPAKGRAVREGDFNGGLHDRPELWTVSRTGRPTQLPAESDHAWTENPAAPDSARQPEERRPTTKATPEQVGLEDVLW